MAVDGTGLIADNEVASVGPAAWDGAGHVNNSPVGVPVSPRRPRGTLWIVAGLTLITVSGLAALSITASLSERVEVLVAADPIAKGEVIGEDDLRTASISPDTGIRAISPNQKAELIGQVAAGPIGEGSIVHPAQFTTGDAEGEPKVIVGAALDAGQYPRTGILPGSKVLVVEVSGSSPSTDDATGGPRELTEGEIVDVTPLAQSDKLLVSFRVNESVAIVISDLAQHDRIRLVQLDDGFADDLIEPLDPANPVTPLDPADPEAADAGSEGTTDPEADGPVDGEEGEG